MSTVLESEVKEYEHGQISTSSTSIHFMEGVISSLFTSFGRTARLERPVDFKKLFAAAQMKNEEQRLDDEELLYCR